MSPDLIPMLLLSLLLMTSGGGDVRTAQLMLSGDHQVTAAAGAIVVGDANVTVPAGAHLAGPIHILGGVTRIHGTVRGDVMQLAGQLVVGDTGEVAGTLQHIGGVASISPDADIGRRTTLDVTPTAAGPVQRYLPPLLLAGLLAAVGARRAHRHPATLRNVARAAQRHPVVSLTVGGLVSVTFLALFVFMAFTLVLLPVSLLGFAVGVAAIGYGVVALGFLAGTLLPIHRVGPATAAGVTVVLALLAVLGAVPVLGDVLLISVVLTGLGAVVITYFGLKEFTPVALPE